MRSLFLLLFVLLSLSSKGQVVITVNRLKGDSLRSAGDIKAAIVAYKSELARKPGNFICAYNLACALSVDRQADSAFVYLWRSLKADTDVVNLDILSDVDLLPLHQDRRWQAVEQDQMSKYQTKNGRAIRDEAFALLLMRLASDDQYYRSQLTDMEKKHGAASKEVQALWALQGEADKRNQQLFLTEVEKKGWPKISDVGSEGARTAFLIVQHSNLATMQKYLPTIKRLCEAGEARCPDYALLYDRVQMEQKKPQLYGSQVYRPKGAQQWRVYPIADEQNLDARRQKIGLPPMEEYAANWGIQYTSKRPHPVAASTNRSHSLDTTFRRGQRIIFQDKSFANTRLGDFPLGWIFGSHQYVDFNWLRPDRFLVSQVKELNGKQSLVVVDSADAKVWDHTLTLGKVGLNNGSEVQLPPSFTIECNFFLVDTICKKYGGCEFGIYFKDYRTKNRNELNVRIANSGQFEMNCNDSSLGPNSSEDVRLFYFNHVRSRGVNTPFHHEVRGTYGGYDKDSWHTLAISYSHRQMRCWLDGRFLGSIESCISPVAFRVFGVAEFGINNITLAALEEEDELSTLVSTRKLVTHAINFEVNRHEVKEASVPFLKEIAAWLVDHKTARLEIAGHTDSTGNPAANMELSRRRAEAIKALLHRYGVESERMVAKGHGPSLPLATNATEDGKAINRRVEFSLY